MAYANIEHTYSGGALTFSTGFATGAKDSGDLYVYVLGELDGLSNQVYRAFTYDEGTGVVTVTNTINGPYPRTVRIERRTTIETPDIDFLAGDEVSRRNLQDNTLQLMRGLQEAVDTAATLRGDHDDLQAEVDALEADITGVVDSAQGYADAAEASATAAAASAVSAGQSANAALAAVASVSRVFASVAAMQAATDLVAGQVVRTAGYYAQADGGGAEYLITNDGLVVDTYGEFILFGGLRARRFEDELTWEQWGAVGDGATDDRARMQALLTFAAAMSLANPWYTDDRNPPAGVFGAQVRITSRPGAVYAITQPLTVTVSNKMIVIDGATMKATGGSWAVTQFMIRGNDGNSGYVTLRNVYLNCAGKCGGIQTRAFWQIDTPVIRRMGTGSVGIDLLGVKCVVRFPNITEWNQNHAEFFNEANYGAIGIRFSDNDHRIIGGEVGWCYELLRHTAGVNHKVIGTHLFNGMESFADYNIDGTTRVANPAGTPAVGRNYHPLFVSEVIAGVPNFKFNDCYMDNGSVHLYHNSVAFVDCEWNANSAHSNGGADDGYWITAYATAVGDATTNIKVMGAVVGVKTVVKRGVRYEPTGANTWAFNNSEIELAVENLWTEKGFEYEHRYSAASVSAGDEVARYMGNGTGSVHMRIKDRTSVKGSKFGTAGEQAIILADSGVRFGSEDGVTTYGTFTSTIARHMGSELYRRANLLGTVSQSAGVPTGAVVERGSNANGEYVRFADGTQICTHTATFSATATATGSLFTTAAADDWTYPIAFVAGSSPTVTGTVLSSTRWINCTAASATLASFRQFNSVTAAGTVSVRLLAIGRWF